MNILAFDPGSRHMGFCLSSPWGRGKQLSPPILIGNTTHTSANVERRMAKASADVKEIIRQARQHGPMAVVYEEPPMHWRKGSPRNGVVAAYMIGQAVGTIRCACETIDCLPHSVKVGEWRRHARSLGMIGSDSKNDAIRWLKRRFSIDTSHDSAEAAMLALVIAANPAIAKIGR